MATSSIPAFMTAYLAAVTAAVPAGTAVYDGPGLPTDANAALQVWIGIETLDDDVPAKQVRGGSQEWRATGKVRDELYEVPGVIVQYDGDGDIAAARAAAFAAAANIESTLISDPAVANTVLYVLLEVNDTDVISDDTGVVYRVYFAVKVRARIT